MTGRLLGWAGRIGGLLRAQDGSERVKGRDSKSYEFEGLQNSLKENFPRSSVVLRTHVIWNTDIWKKIKSGTKVDTFHHSGEFSSCVGNEANTLNIQWVPKVSVRLRGSVGKTRFSKRSHK
ncbi:hypothetical protein OUZ56_010526 [Daphnia magna]|uniref:Uncharacterized protein n=1 Tax=Daphnia magna TaxID=35525 RepID=A0ABR0AIS2_9CRUS|nr:hypothetical protein OUZ56_010526 [Daphnia magna]